MFLLHPPDTVDKTVGIAMLKRLMLFFRFSPSHSFNTVYMVEG
jgi:hypothetical protein